MDNILIVNPFGIGDVLFSFPIIRAVRQAYPESFIGYLCNKRTQPLVSVNPHINEVFVFEKDDYRKLWRGSKVSCAKEFISLLKSIKRHKFDILIDLSLGNRCSLVAKFLGIKKRIGFNYKNRGRFLTCRMDIQGYNDKHVIEYYRDLIRLLGMELVDAQPQLFLKDDDIKWADIFLRDNEIGDNDILIGVIPSSGTSWGKDSHLRRWDYRKFAEVADVLIDRYKVKVILLGDKSDSIICAQMVNLMKNKPIDSSGRTSLREFAAIVQRCRLVICNDGGPLHIAVSVGTKTISIFGPVDERVYGPYPPDGHIVIKNDISCRPCYYKFKMPMCERDLECIKSITVAQVICAAEKLLGK